MSLRDDYDDYPCKPDYDTDAYRGKEELGISTQGMDEVTASQVDRAAARYHREREDADRRYWAEHDTRI